jgi:hypothetical protein
VLRVENVLWVPGVCSQPQRLRSRAMQCCSRMDRCCSCPEDLDSDTTMILGVREGNMYRQKGQAYASHDQQ